MKVFFTELDELMIGQSSIRNIVDQVEKIRSTIKDPEVLTQYVNYVRGIVQREAKFAVINAGGRGMVILPTGSGKSKVAIDLIRYYDSGSNAIIVPTEKLRDENWKEEFEKWGFSPYYTLSEKLCYASASKVKNLYLPGVLVLDEAHNLTELGSEFFFNNTVTNVIAITATKPTDKDKLKLLEELTIPIVYELSLDDAVRLGFVAPYKIIVVNVPLNRDDLNVQGGTKAKPFATTEQKQYEYLTSNYNKSLYTPRAKFAIMKRMQFIYSLKSKQNAAKWILDNLIPEDERVLIFAGTINKAEALCDNFYHSKTDDKGYNLFKEEQTNRLSCVQAINEGHNFPKIDKALVEQLNSSAKDLVQRIGRAIRFRPGHEALIYITVAEGTQDVVWSEKAMTNLDKSNVQYITFTNLKNQYENGDN